MGAFSPVDDIPSELKDKILKKIIKPTLNGMLEEGRRYKGILYAGLMIVRDEPYLLEYNCRFGDPECQVILPRLKNDIVDIMLKTIEGKLNEIFLKWKDEVSLCVIMASKGYPSSYKKGFKITGLDKAKDVLIFHSGTSKKNGDIVTSGGRVLSVTALGENLQEARDKVYNAIDKISWKGAFYRRDIGIFKE